MQIESFKLSFTVLGSLSCLAFMCNTSMGGPSLTPAKRDMSVATWGRDCVLYFVQVLIPQLVGKTGNWQCTPRQPTLDGYLLLDLLDQH